MRCPNPNCRFNEVSGKKFCTKCGTPLVQVNSEPLQRRKCEKNGHIIPEGMVDCPFCPSPQNKPLIPRGQTRVLDKQQLPARKNIPHQASPSSNRGTMYGNAVEKAFVSGQNASDDARSPLIGFLYSFSANENGLHWPVRVGRINIGSAQGNDIALAYPTVSALHARIVIRRTPDELRIYIKDQESMNGTKVNDVEIFNENPILRNGDKITIGNIDLHLLLIDV